MIRRQRPVRLWLGASLLVAGPAMAAEPVATEPTPPDREREYVIGASVQSSAGHLGEPGRSHSLSPVWAFQLGRFWLATGRANGLLSAGRDAVAPGLSAVRVTPGGWRLSTSLQIRGGRESGDDALLRGLPDVRSTLLGRVRVSHDLGPRWNWSLSGTQDLLDRGAGLKLNTGLSYRYPVSRDTHWDASIGLGWGNARSRQTQYGISPNAALASGRAPYTLGSGWDSVSLGLGFTSALSRHWVVFGGLGRSQLLGAAARSPLVGTQTVVSANIGLAYRGWR
ncbi:MAG: MipA/OmpV family protein [Hydrogenophaga sp.]|nr:MipA/OmpV family protein [Hydrogenophaga sp.]